METVKLCNIAEYEDIKLKNIIDDLQYMIDPDCCETQFDFVNEIQTAIDILKKLKTRVLSYDELDESDIVWLEKRMKKGYENNAYVEAALPRTSPFDKRNGEYVFYIRDGRDYDCASIHEIKYYGSAWRCWNKKPTKEQMLQTAWPELEEENA